MPRSKFTSTLCCALSILLTTGCGSGSVAESGGGGGRGDLLDRVPVAVASNDADLAVPSSASASSVDEPQGSFPSPVNHSGAFTHTLPIELPEGIKAMKPTVDLTYSSQAGMGLAGFGWDLTIPQIAVSEAEGSRPSTLAEDLARFDPGSVVERWSSALGRIAAVSDGGSVAYLFNPNNDLRVRPVASDTSSGLPEINGAVAAWEVTARDGSTQLFGGDATSSVWREAGTPGRERKVGWMLQRATDTAGNEVRYFYDEYPKNQDTYRQPSIRAIEYGIPASAPGTMHKYVVLFDYVQVPGPTTSFRQGTRIDTAYVLDKICVHARASVAAATTPGGHARWVLGSGNDLPAMYCYELTYQFETSGPQGYAGRPLLVSVEKIASDGARTPPWTYAYTAQQVDWRSLYQDSIDTPTTGENRWTHAAADASMVLGSSKASPVQKLADANGDGFVDSISGAPDGTVSVKLATADGYAEEHWAHPLAALDPVELSGTLLSTKDSRRSNTWYDFEVELSWSGGGSGLGYARALTAAPEDFYDIYDESTVSDEAESDYEDLGLFQFLSSGYYGPYPKIGYRNAVALARTIDELESFGAFKNRKPQEYAFDFRSSDGEDAGDDAEIDYCWNAGTGRTGAMGADLSCLDAAGSRWFTANRSYESYTSGLWELRDMNGDGLDDWVFGANIMQRDESGALRDLRFANDWWVAFGNGAGWDAPARWAMPPKTGSSMGIPGVDIVHNTGLLNTSVSASSAAVSASGMGASVCVGAGGVPSVSPQVGGISIPSSPAAAGSQATSMAATAAAGNSAPSMGMSLMSSAASIAGGGTPLPSLCFDISSSGATPSVQLPIIGDIVQKVQGDMTSARTHLYQGLMDLTGDGRPDYVVSRFDVGSELNSIQDWLVYRNTGTGFEKPMVYRFDEPPVQPHGKTAPAISSDYNWNYTKVRWFSSSDPFDTAQYSESHNTSGLVDLNGDGLLDFVTTQFDAGARFPVTSGSAVEWNVYYNRGDGFEAKQSWPFTGGYAVPGCSSISAAPILSRSVFYMDPHDGVGHGFTRQVQGLSDVNGDGLPDYVFMEPFDKEDNLVTDGNCNYLPGGFQVTSNSRDRWISFADPQSLRRPLWVALNTGSGFAPAVEWVDEDGLPLSGGLSARYSASGWFDGQRVDHAWNAGVTGIMDLNADGVPEIASLRGGIGGSTYDLYKIGEGNPDRLETVTSPFGGRLEVEYEFHTEVGADMGPGQWVVSQVVRRDIDTSQTDDGTDVIDGRRYWYEHGIFDREQRRFVGFERVYEQSLEGGGYTMSRFHQSRELEGVLYCREVRRPEDDDPSIGTLVDSRVNAWASGTMADHEPLVAAVDANKAVGAARTVAHAPDAGSFSVEEDESAFGSTPDACMLSYAEETGAVGEAAQDEEEEVVALEASMVYVGTAPDAVSTETDAYRDEDPDADCRAAPLSVPSAPADFPAVADISVVAARAYGGCTTTGHTDVGTLRYVCDDPRGALDEASCGDPDDPGVLLEEELHLWTDLSTAPGQSSPRLLHTQHRIYDAAGTDPFVTDVHFEYDDFGNIVRQEDLGDSTTADDDLIIETEYAAANVADYVVSSACHVRQSMADGTILRERWLGYDGDPAGSCLAPTRGLLTHERRAVDAGNVIDTHRTYTDEGLIESATDGRGNTTWTVYDAGFPWLVTRQEQSISYLSAVMGTAKTTVSRTRTSASRYHGVHDGDFARFGLRFEEEDENGALTRYTYDTLRRRTKVYKPMDGGTPSETTSYLSTTRPVVVETRSRINSLGAPQWQISRAIHDGFGRVTAIEGDAPPNDAGATTVVSERRRVDASGRVVAAYPIHFAGALSDDESRRTTYDLLGRVTSVTGPNGAVTTRAWDANAYTEEDPDGDVRFAQLDARGNTVVEADYLDAGATHYRTRTRSYLPTGEIALATDASGNTWTQTHDQLGRLVETFSPNSGRRVLHYDANSNPVATYDARALAGSASSRALVTEFDEANRPLWREELASVSMPPALPGPAPAPLTGTTVAITAYWYDVDPSTIPGARLSCPSTEPLGRLGRVERFEDHGTGLTPVSQKEFCYDARGQITRFAHTIDGTTYAFEYTYDNRGQATSIRYPNGETITLAYHVSGAPIRETSSSSGVLMDGTDFGADGRATARTLAGGGLTEVRCHTLGPAEDWLLRRKTLLGGAGSLSCGADASSDTVVGTPALDLRYTYGDRGEVTSRDESIEDPLTGSTTSHAASYGYDELDRLAEETYDGVTVSFEYDVLDNLVGHEGVVQAYGSAARGVRLAGPNALLSTDAGVVLGYDEAGNATSLEDGALTYDLHYDARNRVVGVWAGGSPVQVNHYDEAGKRVASVESAGTTVFVTDDYRVDADGTSVVLRPGIGLIERDPSGSSAAYFAAHDEVGSTSALFDASGSLVQYTRYRGFGAIRDHMTHDPDVTDGVTPYETPDLFDGQRRQDVFGGADVYDFGARLYLASTGRWLGADPTFVDGLNQYAFVRNDPVNHRDVGGYASDEVIERYVDDTRNGGWVEFGGVYVVRGQLETGPGGQPVAYVGMSQHLHDRPTQERHKSVRTVLRNVADETLQVTLYKIKPSALSAGQEGNGWGAFNDEMELRRFVEKSVFEEIGGCLESRGDTIKYTLNEANMMNDTRFKELQETLGNDGWRSLVTEEHWTWSKGYENACGAYREAPGQPEQQADAPSSAGPAEEETKSLGQRALELLDWAASQVN